jgi:hypothetical protein
MKIESGINALLYTQRTAASGTARTSEATYALSTSSTGAEASQGGGIRQVDFTNMTRQEMRDWVNTQVKSGTMSLEESAPFAAMTMKIPVGGGAEVPAEGDLERIDFTKRIQDGIQGALSRNDETTLKMLQSALATAQKHQGGAIGVDVHA